MQLEQWLALASCAMRASDGADRTLQRVSAPEAAGRAVAVIRQLNAERKQAAAVAADSISELNALPLPAAVAADTREANESSTQATRQASQSRHSPLVLAHLDVSDVLVARSILPAVTVVFLYMLPAVNAFLWPLLLQHLPLGARVFTYTFSLLPEKGEVTEFSWPPDLVLDGKTAYDSIRVYRVTRQLQIDYQAWREAKSKLE